MDAGDSPNLLQNPYLVIQVQNLKPMDSLMQEPTSIHDVQKKSFKEILLQPKIKDKPFDCDVENLSE
ncbi:hypothetical protein U1Q18_041531, partial [Sarracenia purpurea var. burkii]